MGGRLLLIMLVPATKTPFLSFLEHGGFEKKYERVQYGREVFQKRFEVEKCCFLTNILLEIFEHNVLDKAAFLDFKPFFEKLPGRPGPSRIFFETAVLQKAQKRGFS